MSASVLTVSQVNSYVKMLMDSDTHLKNIFITGEISNFNNNYRSGHLYFSLKDERSLIKSVMFSSNASRLRFKPADGMKVIVSGRVSVYEASGQYQLYVESMQPDGIGALTIAYEQLKEKLSEEGLFDNDHKLPVPEFPKRIGVITSSTGAVIRDIKNVVSRRCPLTEIVLCPTSVQGDHAANELSRAVKLFNKQNDVDVIIIGRGGGSFEDLNCFNDESLVRTIYASGIPVISAVGHETDFTLCDFVSDLRAPTPSAAAELAVPDRDVLFKEVSLLGELIRNCAENKLYSEIRSVDKLNGKLSGFSLETYILNEKTYLSSLNKNINYLFKNKIDLEKAMVTAAADKIGALSPINLLKKGYSVVFKDNAAVSSVKNTAVGDKIRVKMSDGEIGCLIEEIKN